MPECLLRDLMIVPPNIAHEGFFQAFGRMEVSRSEYFGDTTIETLYHAIGLGMTWFDESVLNLILMTFLIEKMVASWIALSSLAKTIGEFLAIVGQHFLNFKRRFFHQPLQEGGCIRRGFLVKNFYINPARPS